MTAAIMDLLPTQHGLEMQIQIIDGLGRLEGVEKAMEQFKAMGKFLRESIEYDY